MSIKRFIVSNLAAASLSLTALQVHAVTQEPENLATAGPIGAIIFGVLFVGFCVGVVWMMMRQKNTTERKDPQ